VRWLGLALFLAACGQDESYFHNPTPTNLGKNPYDFSTMKYPRDLSGTVPDDIGVEDDLGCIAGQNCITDAGIPDLTKPHPDLTPISDNHDLTM
jgi:hypothetical protein